MPAPHLDSPETAREFVHSLLAKQGARTINNINNCAMCRYLSVQVLGNNKLTITWIASLRSLVLRRNCPAFALFASSTPCSPWASP